MRVRSILVAMMLLIGMGTAANAATVQSPDNVLENGAAFLWVEAESAVELGGGPPEAAEVGFILVDKDNPIQGITELDDGTEVVNGGRDILPGDTNASGGAAIFHQLGGGGNAKWEVEFAIPATYYLYMHYSFFNRDANTNYGNEDSVYVPPSFNANSRDDWIGFEGIDGDQFEPMPKTGDSNRDGWMPLGKNILSAGEIETHNSTDEDFWEGQFHWSYMDVAVDMDENNSYIGDFGHGIRYEVTEDQVGTVLDFEISGREQYGVIDGLLFSTSNELLEDFSQEQMDEFFLNMGGGTTPGDFDGDGDVDAADIDSISAAINAGNMDSIYDMDGSGVVDADDRSYLIGTTLNTYLGDSNLDGEFNSSDFVAVFTIGEYEDEIAGNSGWADGDWNGDTDFDSSDFVVAFSEAAYETGPKPVATAQVPEPTAIGLLGIAGLMLLMRLRSRR